MTFKEYILEKVSADCSTGSGVIDKIGPWKGFEAVRTKHLDEPRNPPSPIQRDQGFDCVSFDEIMQGLIRKRPLGLADGEYSIFWKNSKGVQSAVVAVNNQTKKVTFVTIMQLNKRSSNDYRIKKGTIKLELGVIKEPK